MTTLNYPRIIRKFLSTPSARRATHTGHHAGCAIDISIHALREEGDVCVVTLGHHVQISIHALREEGDKLWAPLLEPPEVKKCEACKKACMEAEYDNGTTAFHG